MAMQLDGLGRLYKSFNPFGTSITAQMYAFLNYDALGRKVYQQNIDGSSVSWRYTGASVAFTNELSKTWVRSHDGLDRLTHVLEPSLAGVIPTTTYTYVAVDDLLTVLQSGSAAEPSRTRMFSYDPFSR